MTWAAHCLERADQCSHRARECSDPALEEQYWLMALDWLAAAHTPPLRDEPAAP